MRVRLQRHQRVGDEGKASETSGGGMRGRLQRRQRAGDEGKASETSESGG